MSHLFEIDITTANGSLKKLYRANSIQQISDCMSSEVGHYEAVLQPLSNDVSVIENDALLQELSGVIASIKNRVSESLTQQAEPEHQFLLAKRNDSWGEWVELGRSPEDESIYLGFKIIDSKLFEISGNYIAYQSEYDADEVPWTPVVSVDSDAINQLLGADFGKDFGQFPVIDSGTKTGLEQVTELKSKAGYRVSSDGEFEAVKDGSIDSKPAARRKP